MFKTTLKNLRARKFRLITTGFAVLLGVAFVAGTLVLTDTVSKTFDDLFSDVFATTDAQVRAVEPFEVDTDNGPAITRPRVDASLIEQVAAVEGVKEAQGDVFGYAQIVGKDGEPVGNPGQGPPTFGGNWTDSELNTWTLAEGRDPEADDEVVIDAKSAKDGELAVDDETTVLTQAGPVEVTIVGIATFGDLDSPGGSSFAGFTTEAAQQNLAEPGKFDSISVVADDGVSEEQVRDNIAAAMPADIEVITGTELTEENKDDIQQFIDIFGTFMLVFALIALFVGSFIIYNTFSILVAQRTREMALLRAIGASRRQVTMSVLFEAFIVGVIASVLGLLAGIGVAVGLKALLAGFGFDLPATSLAIEPTTAVWSLLLGVVVSVFAAWFPARRGAKVPPIAAMRDVAIDHVGRPRLRIGVGAVLAALGLLMLFSGLAGGDNALAMVGFGALLTLLAVTALGPLAARPVSAVLGRPVAALKGTSGVLARENAMRNPRRTSTTASALMIGVALIGFITIFASSAKASIDEIFDQQFTGDFVMDTETFGFGGVSPQMADELRELPEVKAVSPVRVGAAEVDGKGASFQAFKASELDDIADLDVQQGSLDDLDENSFAILDEKAEDEGWEIGTKVPFFFTDGGRKELTVKVIYGNKELANRYFVDVSVLDANVADQYDSIVFAKLADGVSVDEARPAITAITDRYPNVKLEDRDQFIEDQSGQINQMLALIYVLLFLAIIIALFGIANTLALSIVERTRELGLLRALGMTRKQLKAMIRWEAVLIALFGTIGGLSVGTFFAWAMMQALEEEGFKAFNVPVLQLVIIAIVAALFGVVAAMLPARRASKLNVLKAISSE